MSAESDHKCPKCGTEWCAIPPSDCPTCSIPDYDKPSKIITIENVAMGTKNVMELFPSRKRSDVFRVLVNGKLWLESAGYSRILAGIRKAR